MKKILLILSLFLPFLVKAQFSVTQTLGSNVTMVKSKGGLGSDSGLVISANFADTAAANRSVIKNIPDIYITAVDSLWKRNHAATRWINQGREGVQVEEDPIYTANGVPKVTTLTINGVALNLSANRSWTIPVFTTSDEIDPVYTANGVPKTRILTINGVALNLSADRTWSETDPTAWHRLGDASTNPSTNYVGSSDAQDVSHRRNAVEQFRLESGLNSISNGIDLVFRKTSSIGAKLSASGAYSGGTSLGLTPESGTNSTLGFSVISNGTGSASAGIQSPGGVVSFYMQSGTTPRGSLQIVNYSKTGVFTPNEFHVILGYTSGTIAGVVQKQPPLIFNNYGYDPIGNSTGKIMQIGDSVSSDRRAGRVYFFGQVMLNHPQDTSVYTVPIIWDTAKLSNTLVPGAVEFDVATDELYFTNHSGRTKLSNQSGGGGGSYTADESTVHLATSVFSIKTTYPGQASIVTVGTLTGGATGSGFTVALGTSTITGALATANGGNPTGGSTGQVLTKNSGTNYDYSWATPSGGSLSGGSTNKLMIWGSSTSATYDADLSYDASTDRLTAPRITLTGTTVGATPDAIFLINGNISVTNNVHLIRGGSTISITSGGGGVAFVDGQFTFSSVVDQDHMVDFQSRSVMSISAGHTVTNMYGAFIQQTLSGGGHATSVAGIEIANVPFNDGSTADDQYGLHVNSMLNATRNWVVGLETGNSYSQGFFGFGLGTTSGHANAPLSAADINTLGLGYATKEGNYTTAGTVTVINSDANSNTITLETAVGIKRRVYCVMNTASGETVTLNTTSSQTINGSTSMTLANGDIVWVMSDNANWKIVGRYVASGGGGSYTADETTVHLASSVFSIKTTYPGQVSIVTTGTLTSGTLGTGYVIARPTMTLGSDATGDTYYRNSSGIWTRLGIGSTGQVLTVASGLPSWANASSGFTNPMTTAGDMIVGGSSGVAARLGLGSNGQVLTITSGAIGWATPSGGGGISPTYTELSGNITISSAAVSYSVWVNPSGSATDYEVTLPDVTTVTGKVFVFKNLAGSGHYLTITPHGTGGAEPMDGYWNKDINNAGSWWIVAGATRWYVIAQQ